MSDSTDETPASGRLLTVQEASIALGMTDGNVRRLESLGELRAAGRTPRGGPLFDPVEVGRIATARAARPGGLPSLSSLTARRRPWDDAALGPVSPLSRGTDEGAQRARILAWLECLGESDQAERRVALVHRSGELVAADRMTGETDLPALASRLARALADDGEMRGGRQAYRLGPIGGDGPPLALTTRAEQDDERNAGSAASLSVQAVAHNEHLLAKMLEQTEVSRRAYSESRNEERAMYERVIRGLEALLDKSEARVAQLEARGEEIAKLREAALNDGAERDILKLNAAAERERAAEEARTNQRLTERSLGLALNLAPSLFAPLLKKAGFAVPDNFGQEAVVTETASSLFGKLDPRRRALFRQAVSGELGEVAATQFDALCAAFPEAGATPPPGQSSPAAPDDTPIPPELEAEFQALLARAEAARAQPKGAT